MGGTSIGGRRRRDALYYPLLPGTVNIAPPTGTDDLDAAEALRTAIEMEGPETVAAFIGEPVAIMQFTIPDADYWPRVREICDEYGVLMIADETLTGCCRTRPVLGHPALGRHARRARRREGRQLGLRAGRRDDRPRARSTRRSATTSRRPRSRATAGTARAPRPAPGRSRSTRPSGWTRSRSGAAPSSRRASRTLRDHPLVARHPARRAVAGARAAATRATGESLARGPARAVGGRAAAEPAAAGARLAAARMSEGLLHVAPPFIATDSDFDFIVGAGRRRPRRRRPRRSPGL